MEIKSFVNEFLSAGFHDFYYKKDSPSFESHIIECLTDIYGQEVLKKLYEEGDENGFVELISSYGVKPNMYDNFIDACNKYENFIKERQKNPAIKSDRASMVEIAVVSFYICKYLTTTPTLEELSHFENDLLNNFSVIKEHFNMSLDPNKTREYWNNKKRVLYNNYDLFEIKPDYLDEFTYAKYGVKIEDVRKMDARMVQELNKYIVDKLQKEEKQNASNSKKMKLDLGNTIISSGNGYVDALLMVAIIVTELAIGFIVFFLNY